jgi:hypothetical protein
MVKYKLNNNTGKCDYEGYNNKSRSMVKCGCDSSIMAGKNYVCLGHLNFALQSDRKPEVFALDGVEITIKRFKELANNFKPIIKEEKIVKWM